MRNSFFILLTICNGTELQWLTGAHFKFSSNGQMKSSSSLTSIRLLKIPTFYSTHGIAWTHGFYTKLDIYPLLDLSSRWVRVQLFPQQLASRANSHVRWAAVSPSSEHTDGLRVPRRCTDFPLYNSALSQDTLAAAGELPLKEIAQWQ